MVDLTFLKQFTKGDSKKIQRYIRLYLQVAPETLDKMRDNLEEEDWDQLRIHAHSLKPQADYMGIFELKDILINIEEDIKNENYAQIMYLVNKAREIHHSSVDDLIRFSE